MVVQPSDTATGAPLRITASRLRGASRAQLLSLHEFSPGVCRCDVNTTQMRHTPQPRRKWGKTVLLLLCTIVLLSFWGAFTYTASRIKLFRMPSESMAPAVKRGAQLVVDTHDRSPTLGSLIMFRAPNQQDNVYLKRVVALPGDTVSFEGGVFVRNGVPLEVSNGCPESHDSQGYATERYLDTCVRVSTPAIPPNTAPTQVPDEHVYVLGDQRSQSLDSRTFGPVPFENISGALLFSF